MCYSSVRDTSALTGLTYQETDKKQVNKRVGADSNRRGCVLGAVGEGCVRWECLRSSLHRAGRAPGEELEKER